MNTKRLFIHVIIQQMSVKCLWVWEDIKIENYHKEYEQNLTESSTSAKSVAAIFSVMSVLQEMVSFFSMTYPSRELRAIWQEEDAIDISKH